jgi:hypothetical protein
MNKVYFNKDYYGNWWIKELEDFFYIKATHFQTNEEFNLIFSWTRNVDLSEYQPEPVRKYDVEIEDEKFFFLVYPEKDGYIVESEDKMKLEKLLNDKNIIFVGHDLD